jgi:hypothetical protein
MSDIRKAFKIAFSMMVLATTLSGSVAFAQGKNADQFHRNTAPSTGGYSSQMPISGNAALGKNDPVSRWFDGIDYAFYEHRVEPKDALKIARPFNGDAKRVEEWSTAVKSAAQKYRDYARILRAMPLPPGVAGGTTDLQSYKNASADYYDDSADYLEDWIRPRRPAVTREDLQAQLDQMHQRAEGLKMQNQSLQIIDKELRDRFDVRPRDDKLMQYVAKRPQQN